MDAQLKAKIAKQVLLVSDLREMLENYPDDAEVHTITDWSPGGGMSTAAVIATYRSALGPNDDGLPYNPGRVVFMLEPYGVDDTEQGDMAHDTQRSR